MPATHGLKGTNEALIAKGFLVEKLNAITMQFEK